MGVIINDLDAATTYGLRIAEAPGWMDAPPRTVPTAAVLRRGGVRTLGAPHEQPRRLSLRGTIIGSSASDARAKVDALKTALARVPVKLAFPDAPTRYVNARLDSFAMPPVPASMSDQARKLSVEAALTAHDPYSYETTETSVGSGVAMPLGSGPVRPKVTLTYGAAATDPTLTLKDNAGNTVATMTLTRALALNDVLVIDHDAQTITLNGVGILSALTAGDFFIVDPAEARYMAPWPSITVTHATGAAATVAVAYRKTWR